MIYFAGPLFSAAERSYNRQLSTSLSAQLNEKIFLPQNECASVQTSEQIFNICKKGINASRLVIAILDGADSDSGTCFETGYAHAKSIPIIGVRTDFRNCGDDGGLNLMLSQSCDSIIIISSLDIEDSIKEITQKIFDAVKPLN